MGLKTIEPLPDATPVERSDAQAILHAWYPAGVVAGSLIGIFGDQAGLSWRLMYVPLGLLCIAFGVMALKERLPDVGL